MTPPDTAYDLMERMAATLNTGVHDFAKQNKHGSPKFGIGMARRLVWDLHVWMNDRKKVSEEQLQSLEERFGRGQIATSSTKSAQACSSFGTPL